MGYGNGAFKSVAQQIVLLSSRTDLCNYNTLDIEGNKDAIFSDLRNLLVKYLQHNPEDYNGMSHVFFLLEMKAYALNGSFSGQVGDIVMKVVSEKS